MVVYAVVACDKYYPCADNVVKMFSNYQAASSFLEEVPNMVDRDYYDIIEYEVEE
jgi:hypothetical protein